MSTRDTRNRSPIGSLGTFGLSDGSLSQKAGEDIEAFMDRMVVELPEVLVKAEGNLDIAGAVFACDTAVMKDMVKSYAILDEARAEGQRIGLARDKGEDDAANAAQERALNHVREVESKLRITEWSGNEAQRHNKLMQLLPRALADYGGSETAIATALSLTVDEVSAAIASDPTMEELQEKAFVALVGGIEDHLFSLAITSQSPTAAIFVLKNLVPQKYSDKQQVEVSGFAKPPEIVELPSVLNVVNGGKIGKK